MLDIDWINTRAAQSFPLSQTASGLDKNGNRLPDSFLLDLQLLLPSKYDQDLSGAFYISSIQDRSGTFTVVISYHPANAPANSSQDIQCAICSGISKSLTVTSSITERTYVIVPLQTNTGLLQQNPWLNKITGNLCVGNTATYTGGSMFFLYDGSVIHSSCIKFMGGDHLEGIKIGEQLLTGVVQFVAGQGISFTVQNNTVKISVDQIALQNKWNDIVTTYFSDNYDQPLTPIKTINGLQPDANGNITITGLECVQVSNLSHGISIKNTCARPCCTVDSSLQNLQASLKVMQQEQQILRDYYINMSTVVNYMQANLSTLMRQF